MIDARDKEFPVGTKVINTWGEVATVKDGSLYPHQINTSIGHMNWRMADKINETSGGESE